MKILILGGTGAMGVSLVEFLARNGSEVVVTSRKQHQNKKNITYIKGNAHNMEFLGELLKENFDVIVDFMIYTLEELQERKDLLLSSTQQYLFLSSSRVYAESNEPIEEVSPRLLDVCNDDVYLKTSEYALAKAREEDVLINSNYKNWTIIRPYITYSNIRLQLGVLEKELWLYRALRGKSIVFSNELAKRFTTMTYGYDVSKVMVKLIGNSKALGECINITTSETCQWSDILNIYLDVIEEVTNHRPKIKLIDFESGITTLLKNEYQYRYDRLFNRSFNIKKVDMICDEKIDYCELKNGLEKCLREFILGNRSFGKINWKFEAYADCICGERTKLKEIDTFKNKLKYFVCRYTPYFRLKGIK